MKLRLTLLAALVAMVLAPKAWAQTYSGELIFNQGDFRQMDDLATGPLTGGVTNGNLSVSSVGGSFYQNGDTPSNSNSMTWSIQIPLGAAKAMTSGTGTTTYSGYFTYGQPSGAVTVIGAGQLNGSSANGTTTLQTVNGLLGVGGVNPTTLSAGDPNIANFNWTMTMPTSALTAFIGSN